MNDDDEEDEDDVPQMPFSWYFQIDTEWLKKYESQLDKLTNDIFNTFSPVSLPVNSWLPSIGENKTSLYLGNNYYNEGVWKPKHFIRQDLYNEYVNHLQSHAGYFLQQPKYYKGLYEILN